ncbi:methyltransferase family protein [Hoeflea marina]|uniref:Methyltransferase family protein n=1 Tax=Hoeflea marina TaxID=274592 RepID=A0A317PHU8_9HYPH|nr:class I SAM-dependent methyltransferase [Hoeflea marina]PWW00199.1 methyltransferase family protein [Hoeflea marina]
MNREQTNRIRFAIEELLPPILRDSRIFVQLSRLVWGKHIDKLADFRRRAPFLTSEEYEALYTEHPRVHNDTDNSKACIAQIALDLVGDSVCDVGCGTGFLLRNLAERRSEIDRRLVGVDFVIPDFFSDEGIEFVKAPIENLPFADEEFDTVICTHVIEHILDYRRALAELRRITRKRLIIVVPREREAIFTFNPHFNFFPYKHSFLRAIQPLPFEFRCMDIGRDIYFAEDKAKPI